MAIITKQIATYTDFNGHTYAMHSVDNTDTVMLSIHRKDKEIQNWVACSNIPNLNSWFPDCNGSQTALLISWVAYRYQFDLERAKDIRAKAQVLLNEANSIENEWM